MTLRFHVLSLLLVLFGSNCFGQYVQDSDQISVMPSKPGLVVGVLKSDEPGGWAVMHYSPLTGFRIIQPDIYNEGRVAIFEALPDKYAALFFREGVIQPEVKNIDLGKPTPPGPGPDPDPDPDPEPDPEPDPDPDPDIPPDAYGNLARNVAKWATELELDNKKEIGALYYDAGRRLAGEVEPGELIIPTIDMAVSYITTESKKFTTTKKVSWGEWQTRVSGPWNQYVVDRASAAGVFKAVGIGLKGAK